MYYTLLHCTGVYCTELVNKVLYCTALIYPAVNCTLHYTFLYYTVLHCTVLHYTALNITEMKRNRLHCTKVAWSPTGQWHMKWWALNTVSIVLTTSHAFSLKYGAISWHVSFSWAFVLPSQSFLSGLVIDCMQYFLVQSDASEATLRHWGNIYKLYRRYTFLREGHHFVLYVLNGEATLWQKLHELYSFLTVNQQSNKYCFQK